MPLENVTVMEEALSLPPENRAALIRLLIQSLEGDSRTDENIGVELDYRLKTLLSGEDNGLSFEEVFNKPL